MSASSLRANPNRGREPKDLPPSVRWRFWLSGLMMVAWALAICLRLFWLQVAEHQHYLEVARKQQVGVHELQPRRGVVYDRNRREIAVSINADSISADPALMVKPDFCVPDGKPVNPSDSCPTSAAKLEAEGLLAEIHQLAQVLNAGGQDPFTQEDEIRQRVDASLDQIIARNRAAKCRDCSHGLVWIAHKVTPQVAAQVKALNLRGIYPEKEFQRSYPDAVLAAQALGYVGDDDKGLGGIEQKFEPQLHGKPGSRRVFIDAHGKPLGSDDKAAEAGEDLMLTLDENIQFLAERALDQAMTRTQAANGTVVIQDVHTGQILALAIRPTFNPNDFRHTSPALLKNHAISDVYEPGSTFKLVTYSAALDQHLVTPDDIIDCQGGAIQLPGRVIHDDKSDHFGKITIHEALEHSSDVAAVKLALKMGPQNFYHYIRDFGFGSRSGLELPGETRGLLSNGNKWTISTLGSVSIGQEVAVTPLQLVSMVSTIANGGVYMPPRMVMPTPQAKPGEPAPALVAQPFHAGEELPNPLPARAHRVISTMTAAQMRKMMEGVVLFGTGKAAQLNGYSAGGKTGTAQKIDPATRTYSKTKHVASFAGIAPVNNPVIAMAVVLDEPKGDYYGGSASAPVFAEVAQQVLEYLGVPHDEEVHAVRPAKPLSAKDTEPMQEHSGDARVLLAAAQELPEDDPLRQAAEASLAGENGGHLPPAPSLPAPAQETAVVTVETGKRVKVPNLVGMPVRQVVEAMAVAGLVPEITGRGLVRSQEPAAGTVVAAGSKVTVRCAR